MQGYEITREGIRLNSLLAVVISADDRRRRSIVSVLAGEGVTVTQEFGKYPELDDLLRALAQECDIVVVDLDPEQEAGLSLVEDICGRYPTLTVMVYSSSHDPDLLVRCMRAGTREFLTEPISSDALPDALVRASARRSEALRSKRLTGKLLVFAGAKGGAGVTTVASNFAIALKEESGQHIALVDVNLHLGDVSVLLGLAPKFNILDALASGNRMDRELISTLLIDYDPKLSVLAGPDQFQAGVSADAGNVRKLLNIMRARFSYVVVDGGSALRPQAETLFEAADTVYLVTQAEIPSLRNAQRILSHLQMQGRPSVEVVVNRFDSRHTGINEAQIEKALTVPLKWKLPEDYPLVRRSNDTGAPLILQKCALSASLRQMACSACGKAAPDNKKRKFGMFGR
jgi:pilus assembly protein CpaE